MCSIGNLPLSPVNRRCTKIKSKKSVRPHALNVPFPVQWARRPMKNLLPGLAAIPPAFRNEVNTGMNGSRIIGVFKGWNTESRVALGGVGKDWHLIFTSAIVDIIISPECLAFSLDKLR